MRSRAAGRVLLALWTALLVAGVAAQDKAGSSLATRVLSLPEVPFHYDNLVELPIHFRQGDAQRFDNTPQDNPITDAGATLGLHRS